MELEMRATQLSGYEELADTTLFSEETMECIVPDACPDIQRILDTRGTVCLNSKEAQEGRVEFRGVVRTCVLYLPEGESGICKMEVTIPFICSADLPGIGPETCLHVIPRLLQADTRMLNPRKVYVRAEVALGWTACVPGGTRCTAGGDWEANLGVEQKLEERTAYLISCVQEKPFTFSDDLTLPGSKPDCAQLLHSSVEPVCTESKVIGNKLIFKGQALLTILYRTGEDALVTTLFELPFSQIMEMPGGGEEADCDLSVILTDLTCGVDEDGRTVSLSMGLLAQAVLREERRLEVVTDLYSTAYQALVEREETALHRLGGKGVCHETVREVVETTTAVRSVVDCRLALGRVSQSWEGTVLHLEADARATVLYWGEDEGLYTVTRTIPVHCESEAEPGSRCACRCLCPGELYATPTMGGVEVRFPLDFHCRWEARQPMTQVVSVRLEEPAGEMGRRPSLVLKRMGAGEALWDIAKTYATTEREIALVNELAQGAQTQGLLLLIPSSR